MRPKKGELTYNEIVKSGTIRLAPGSVADPDPHGSEPFGRIRIQSNCTDTVPDLTTQSQKYI